MATRDKASRLGTAINLLIVSGAVFKTGGVTWRLLLPAAAAPETRRGLLIVAHGRF
jgi:hypothetical protein